MRATVGIVCAVLAAFTGCGRGKPALVPVSGRVFFQGKPLTGGTIVFTPDPKRGGRGSLACAEIGADGRFTLRTSGQPGAAAGWHRVTVADPSVPRRYCDPDLADRCVEIKPNKANVQDLHLD